MDQNLPELRDIHLPMEVSPFPIAYGWWLVLAAIIILALMVKLVIRIRRYSKSRYAIRLLSAIAPNNPIFAAQQMSEILRRICVYKYKNATTLMGKEWLDFLNNHSKNKLSGKSAELLANAPYLPQESEKYNWDDAEKLRNFCKNWIGENL